MACRLHSGTIALRSLAEPLRPQPRPHSTTLPRSPTRNDAAGHVLLQTVDQETVTILGPIDPNVACVSSSQSPSRELRRPLESAQYGSEAFQRLLVDHGIVYSMSRAGNVWDNAAAESFFSSMKTERVSRKVYRTRDEARADVFDYIERFYNPRRRHSTLGYESPVAFEAKMTVA